MTRYNTLPLLLTGFCALFLSACSTAGNTEAVPTTRAAETQTNLSNQQSASRVDRAFERALSQARATGNPQDIIAVIEPFYKSQKDNPLVVAEYARALREDNQLNTAKRVLQPYKVETKEHPETWTELAMVTLTLGEYKEAELAARSATRMDKSAGRAYLALGTALDAQGHYAQAEDAFRQGLRVWKGDAAPILNNLALNLASQGHYQQALDILDRARKEYPHRIELERNFRIISTLNNVRPSSVSVDKPVAKPSVKPDKSEDKAQENKKNTAPKQQEASATAPAVPTRSNINN